MRKIDFRIAVRTGESKGGYKVSLFSLDYKGGTVELNFG